MKTTRSVETEGLWGSTAHGPQGTASASSFLLASCSVVARFCPVCHLLRPCFPFHLWLAVFVVKMGRWNYKNHRTGHEPKYTPQYRSPSFSKKLWLPTCTMLGEQDDWWPVLGTCSFHRHFCSAEPVPSWSRESVQGFTRNVQWDLHSVSPSRTSPPVNGAGDRPLPGDLFIALFCTAHTGSAYSFHPPVSSYQNSPNFISILNLPILSVFNPNSH